MRQISIKQHSTLKRKNNETFTTVDMIKDVLEQRPQEGFTIAEMRDRIKILDKLEALHPDTTVIDFEDSEFEIVKRVTEAMRWAYVDKFITDFHDELLTASASK